MTKDISTLVEDIYHVLSDQTDHEVDEANVQAAGEAFKEILRTRFTRREERSGEDVLRFSSIGKKDRQIYYEAVNAPKEVLPPATMLKFLYGDCIEVLMLFLAKEAGHTVTHEQHEVEVDGVLGHTDCMIDGEMVDVKSASDYSFNKFRSGEYVFDDAFGYIPQLSGYCHALGKSNGYFLVANKVSGAICLAGLSDRDVASNPPAPRIAHLKDVIKADSPPPRCYKPVPEGKSGNLKLGIGCSYCSRKEHCWADANNGEGLRRFQYSRGPTWLVKVAKEPRVEEDGGWKKN